jgi:hypothetical protein
MKYLIISSIFVTLSLFSMDKDTKTLLVTTTTNSRSTFAKTSAAQVTLEQCNQRHDKHENCCTIVARLFYNLPMAIVSLPVVWADEMLNNINEKLKVD